MSTRSQAYHETDLRDQLRRMAREILQVREDRNSERPQTQTQRNGHRFRMMEIWARVAELTGHQDLVRQAGMDLSGRPGSALISPNERLDQVELREQLSRLQQAIQEQDRPNTQASWERLATLLDHGRMALEHSREQPIIHFNTIGNDPFRALVVGLFHLENARVRYELIAADPGSGSDPGSDPWTTLHAAAEREAKLAHRTLWFVQNELTGESTMWEREEKRTMERFIQNYSKSCHSELMAARRAAAAAMGLPEPAATGLDELDI